MRYFVKLKNWWWEYDETLPRSCTTLYNYAGGKTSDIDIEGMETATAEAFSDLNWYGTEVYDNKYKTGWLSPEGKFYGCDYRRHSAQAKFVHNKSECDLEDAGWVKISYRLYYNKDGTQHLEAMFFAKNKTIYPTNGQLNYIKTHYQGKEKEEILGYLIRTRIMRCEQIKKDWGIQK